MYSMTSNFARHEQFLRIFALLDILSEARQPIDDQALIAMIRERLGLSQLSPRTLRRDCEFLTSCGYPVDHKPMAGSRKFGWQLAQSSVGGRKIPGEPLTLLELVAFAVGRDLLQSFEGTVLWTGIESLRQKLERDMSPSLREQFDAARRVFHVSGGEPGRYAGRPRLISTLTAAITDCEEIDVVARDDAGGPSQRHRLRPHCLIVQPPRAELLAFPADGSAADPLLIDIDRIEEVVTTDATFPRHEVDVAKILERRTP
jgi:predicted DNA-binding transcriptional regulator YafY